MKAIKITYWITTALISLMMSFSAYAYLTVPDMHTNFLHLGFSDSFRIELAIAKVVGALLLLLPVSSTLKEWTYAGFTIVFISAAIAHTSSGDPAANIMGPLVFLALLAVSYIMYHKITHAGLKTGAVKG